MTKNCLSGPKFGGLPLLITLLLLVSITSYGQNPDPGHALGVDVSERNSNTNPQTAFSADQWKTIKTQFGLSYAILKVSEGKDHADVTFHDNAVNAESNNLMIGVYHYARPYLNTNAADEAHYFLTKAGQYVTGNYLPPALDIEVSGKLTKAQLTAWVVTWLSTVQNESSNHVVPLVYTYKSFLTDYLNPDAIVDKSTGNLYPVWIADYAGNFSRPWVFKQFQGDPKPAMLTDFGFKNGFDRDEYNGSVAALQTLIGQHTTVALADLTITAGTQTAAPATVTAGSNLALSCSEDNSGNAAASANDVTVWLSADPVLTQSDTY